MIRPASWLGLLAALICSGGLWAGAAAAQTGAAAGGAHAGLGAADSVGDVPGGDATIRGRVVRLGQAEPLADVAVTLFALGSDGRPGIRRATTGADGDFEFGGVSGDPSTVYLIGAHYGDIPFGARLAFAPGERERDAVIEVADTTTDTSSLAVGAARLRVDRGCTGIRVSETHELRNPTNLVLHVPPAERATAEPIFRIPLPAAAVSFAAGRASFAENVIRRDDEVLFYGPLYPGEGQVEFSYSLAGDARSVAVERRFPQGAEKAVVLTAEGGPPARGDGLTPAGATRVGEFTYGTVESGALAPGQTLSFELDLGAAPTSREDVTLSEVKLWLELDDAALDVQEQYRLTVNTDAPLQGDSNAPLVCLPLPEGAEEVRFSQDAFGMGLQPDATGGIALRGPLPSGDSIFGLSYLLRSRDGAADFERRFHKHISLLTMYVADTGIVVDSERMHRRRPVQTPDRTYLHLEAFEIGADEAIAVGLTSLASPRRLPRLASAGFVAGAAVLVVALLAAPLRRPPGETAEVHATTSAEDERAAVYDTIRDLEDDFETGKISEEDHASMLAELRARAGSLLKQQRASGSGDARPARAPATPPACSACGADLAAESRFCSQCGARVAAQPSAENATA